MEAITNRQATNITNASETMNIKFARPDIHADTYVIDNEFADNLETVLSQKNIKY